MKKLLIAKTSAFGDVVQTFYVIEDIARARPDLQIYWCVEERFFALAQLQPSVKTVIPFPAKEWVKKIARWSTWRAIRAWIGALRSFEFDIALDLQGMYKSAFICWASGAALRVGRTRFSSVEGLSNLVFNVRYDFSRHPGIAGRLRHFASSALGYRLLDLPLRSGLASCQSREKIIAIVIGASNPKKSWPLQNWQDFLKLAEADQYLEKFTFTVVWGSLSEKQQAGTLTKLHKRVRPLSELKTAPDLATFFQSCALVIGADTGPSHFAVGLGVPVVMLFGKTSPKHNAGPEAANLYALGSGRGWPTAAELVESVRSHRNLQGRSIICD